MENMEVTNIGKIEFAKGSQYEKEYNKQLLELKRYEESLVSVSQWL
jgi:hypothetical protein